MISYYMRNKNSCLPCPAGYSTISLLMVDDDQSWILHPFTASHLDFCRIMHCSLKLPFFNKGLLIQEKALGESSSTGRGEQESVLNTGFLQIKLKAYTLFVGIPLELNGQDREIQTEREQQRENFKKLRISHVNCTCQCTGRQLDMTAIQKHIMTKSSL